MDSKEILYHWFSGTLVKNGQVIGRINAPCRVQDDKVFFVELADGVLLDDLDGDFYPIFSPVLPDIPWSNAPIGFNAHAYDPYGDGYFARVEKQDDGAFVVHEEMESGLKMPYGVDWRGTLTFLDGADE